MVGAMADFDALDIHLRALRFTVDAASDAADGVSRGRCASIDVSIGGLARLRRDLPLHRRGGRLEVAGEDLAGHQGLAQPRAAGSLSRAPPHRIRDSPHRTHSGARK